MSDRTPSTDALETLGMIHFKPEARDAIHLVVEPMKAGCPLVVGEKIGIIYGVAYPTGPLIMKDGSNIKVPYHGIVDPFLPATVEEGQFFWFVMDPRSDYSFR